MKSKKKRRQLFALLLCVMLALNVVLSASASEIVDGTTGTIETTEEPSVEAEKEAPEEKTKASQEEKEVPQEEAEALEAIMQKGYEVEFALIKEAAIGNWKKFRGQFGFN